MGLIKKQQKIQTELDYFNNILPAVGINRFIGLEDRLFGYCQGDLGSIPGHVIPKTLKVVLDTSLLNNQQYKVRIKGKVEQSREMSRALHCTLV